MTYKILCKKIELADASKEKLLHKVKKLDKFFDDDSVECKINVSEIREIMIVEITFPYKGFIIRAEAQNSDMLTAVEDCMSSIDRQIRKNKTKLSKHLRDGGIKNYDVGIAPGEIQDEHEEFKIIKTKKLSTKPMMTEEAILQMNMLGHDFFIFTNPETMDPSIVYRRKDGNYALIELD